MSHLRAQATLFAAVLALSSGAFAAEEHREQGAHQHGHGSFEMAIEKTTVSISLTIPGDDIVGFEHSPANAKETAAIEAAKKSLADALTLFGIPKEAGCKVETADVHTHGYKADDDHKHEDKAAAPADAKKEADHDHKHGSFHGKYTLACAKPSAITALNFKFFATFPRSQELDIVAVSEKSQVKVEATRKKPNVALKGLW
jgi:hypothetical protein